MISELLLALGFTLSQVVFAEDREIADTPLRDFKFDDMLKGTYHSQKLFFINQDRMFMNFDIENIDMRNWEENKDGFWFALGYGLVNENHWSYDLVMCEYIYRPEANETQDKEVTCYDRFWDNKEYYEDDQLFDSIFIFEQSKEIKDGKLNLKVSLVKKFSTALGSLDDKIQDGEKL